MRQGNRSVADFAIDFHTRARESSWNPASLCEAFLFSLADYIKDELVSYELPSNLDGLIYLATRIDLGIQSRRRERGQRLPGHFPPDPSGRTAVTLIHDHRTRTPKEEPEPMQVGHSRLTPQDHRCRIEQKLCLYCGQTGHFLSTCPLKDKAHHQVGKKW